ncbi:MAG: hypothetical protein ACE37F_29790 [Nannocystaceae bacterium]|nr:hypothetical protein [bacterium]
MNRHDFLGHALFYFALLTACGPQVEEPEEEVRIFERRRPTCETFCGLVQDPECGSDVEIYTSVQECIDFCVSEEAEYWFLQEDGTDACGEEIAEHYECAASASCEARWIITNVPARIYETPCAETQEAFGDCQVEHRE